MRIITFLLILFGSKLIGQVGIGNTLPEKSLHISGNSSSEVVSGTSINVVKPTIRIDGLNNGNQLITDKIRPVSVTDQGDLVLAPALVKPLIMIDSFNPTNSETDYLASSITTNQTTTTLTTNIVLRSFNFSLFSPSLVRFGAVTSFQFFRADNGNPVTDESNRQWGTRFRFSSAPAGVSTVSTAYFGESLKGYYNRVSNTSATEILYSNSEDIQYLPAGNYTLEVIATAITATGQTPLRVVNGSGSDTFSVIAYPIQ